MRWDDARSRYVLTSTGRRRMSAGSRAPGTVVSFRKRAVMNGGTLQRNPRMLKPGNSGSGNARFDGRARVRGQALPRRPARRHRSQRKLNHSRPLRPS